MLEHLLWPSLILAVGCGFLLGVRMEGYRWRQRCNDMLTALQALKQRQTEQKTKQKAGRFIIVVRSDEFCDYLQDAARGHSMPLSAIRACLEPYILNGRLTLVFNLTGETPYILPNSEKPANGPTNRPANEQGAS